MMLLPLLLVALPQAPTVATLPTAKPEMPRHLAAVPLGERGMQWVAVYGRTFRLLEDATAGELLAPGESTLWTVADVDGDRVAEVLMLVEGNALHRLELRDGVLALSEPLAVGLKAVPPRGLHTADFVQDLDGDGRPDLLLPVGDRLRVWFGSAEGFVEGPNLGAVSSLLLETGSGDLLDPVRRVIEVPRLQPRDINADGRPDLVVTDGVRIHQYVVAADGFPAAPTRTLDLAAYRSDEAFELDLSNVAKAARWILNDEWEDLDGDGDLDVVVLADGMVRVFLGGPSGIEVGAGSEKQVFKIGGNLLYALPARIDADAVPDIVLVRVEDVGIGKLLRMALWSWELAFDFLVFRGRGDGSFDKRPLAQRRVKLAGDSLFDLARGPERERLRELRRRVLRAGDLDGDGRATDLVALEPDGRLQVWRDALQGGSVDSLVGDFLRKALSEDSDVQLDIATLGEWLLGRTSAVAAASGGRPPDLVLQIAEDWAPPHAMALSDMDGDGRDEVLVLRALDDEDGAGPRRLVAYAVHF